MAENEAAQAENATEVDSKAATQEQQAPMEPTAPKWTDESVDAYVKARIDKQRGKHEAEMDEVRARNGELERELEELRHSKAVTEIAAEFGIPSNLIHGQTEEEMRQSAEAVKAYAATIPIHPTVNGNGGNAKPTATKESILAIENERERLEAIRNNAELFTN